MDMHAAVLHGIGQTPRYELFTAPVAGEADALADAGAAFDSLARQVAAGEIILDVKPVPLADVEQTWPQSGSDRRIVFVP
jgi:hypothetical protein